MDQDIERAIAAARVADTREQLWDALEPLAPRLGADRALDAVWAEALRTSPRRASAVDEARSLLERWPGDFAIVAATCDALVRIEERRPIDEPPLTEEGPASIAAAAADRCFGRLDPAAKNDPDIGGQLLAIRGNALRAIGPTRVADAVASLERALALDPNRGSWLYDLGLAHKHGRDFAAALAATERARVTLGDAKPVLWNLAIAATACGDGAKAADAWRSLGIAAEHTPGELPFVADLPPVQVRLPTIGSGHGLAPVVPDRAAGFELVWAQPLSPCHGVIRSPTFRDAVADFGDVVLWDGAPALVTTTESGRVPCFPLLRVLKHGSERRFRFLARQQREGQIEALGALLPEGALLVRQGERVERVCPRCAAGESLVRHEHLPAEEHRVAFGKIVVGGDLPLERFERSLTEARERNPGVLLAIPALYEALGETASAGKHHKRWGEIERTSSRTIQ